MNNIYVCHITHRHITLLVQLNSSQQSCYMPSHSPSKKPYKYDLASIVEIVISHCIASNSLIYVVFQLCVFDLSVAVVLCKIGEPSHRFVFIKISEYKCSSLDDPFQHTHCVHLSRFIQVIPLLITCGGPCSSHRQFTYNITTCACYAYTCSVSNEASISLDFFNNVRSLACLR